MVYARVAGVHDGVKALLNAQVEHGIELAESLGYSKNGAIVLRDVGSGTTLDRPGLNKLRDMAAAGNLEAAFAHGPDRLSRNALDLSALVHELQANGVAVYFVKGRSGSTPDGAMPTSFVGQFGRYQRRLMGERTRRGQMAVARGGRMPAGASSQSEGYDYDPV